MSIKILLPALVFSTACLMPVQGQGSQTSPSSNNSSSSSAYNDPEPSPGMASSPKAATPASAPAGPTTVSVTIRSSCSKTAKVFYGEKPGFSSGTTSSISSNSVQSKTFRPGDLMWVLDDSGKALGSVEIDERTRNLEISSSCTSISSR